MTNTTTKQKSTLARLREWAYPKADTVSRKNGVYTVRRGYFYRFNRSATDLIEDLKRTFPEIVVTGSGDHWAAWNGQAPMHKSSHWWVTFTMPEAS